MESTTDQEQEVKPNIPEIKRKTKKVRKRIVVEEDVVDFADPKKYELVKFIFFNEEQKGVPVSYEWIDKWVKINQCKGTFYDGKTYEIPRIAFEYYRDMCYEPVRANVEQEIVPGHPTMVSKEVGRKYRFRLQEIS